MQVLPKLLEFESPFTVQQTKEVSISNESSNYLAFKVKTTAPKLYCVRPNASTVPPGETVNVHIILQGLGEEPAIGTKCKDKFLFVSVPCDEGVDPKSVSSNWSALQKAAGGKSKGVKMKVAFNYEGAINPIQEAKEEPVADDSVATASDVAGVSGVAAGVAAAGAAAAAASSATTSSSAPGETAASTVSRKVAAAVDGASPVTAAEPAELSEKTPLVPGTPAAAAASADGAVPSAVSEKAAVAVKPAKSSASSIVPVLAVLVLALLAAVVYKVAL